MSLKVWVLYGGSSSEREVSLRTGAGVLKALQDRGFQAEGFDVRPGDLLKLDWSKKPDIVFLGLHGKFGEDGTVQGFLETIGVPYVGSGVLSSALCLHKGYSKVHLQQAGLPCPYSIDLYGPEALKAFEAGNGMPKDFFSAKWFLKAAREGSTIGIERFIPGDHKDPKQAFGELARKAMAFDEYLLVEEWIEGPELTVPVLHGKALPVVEIRPHSKFYDYKSKYTKGETEYLCPAPISVRDTEQAQTLAQAAFEVLDCADYGRVDIMLGAKGPRILEMNTLPGMTETSLVPKSAAAAGMNYGEFVETLVKGSYERQRKA